LLAVPTQTEAAQNEYQ